MSHQFHKFREGGLVEQHRVGAVLLQYKWGRDGMQCPGVGFNQGADYFAGDMRLVR